MINRCQNTDIKTNIINNYPYITIDCDLEYTIQSSKYNTNTEDITKIKTLENTINSYIEEILLNFLYKISKEYNVDICDFQSTHSSNYLTYDEFKKDHFEKIYKDSYFDVKVQGTIYNGGLFSKE